MEVMKVLVANPHMTSIKGRQLTDAVLIANACLGLEGGKGSRDNVQAGY